MNLSIGLHHSDHSDHSYESNQSILAPLLAPLLASLLVSPDVPTVTFFSDAIFDTVDYDLLRSNRWLSLRGRVVIPDACKNNDQYKTIDPVAQWTMWNHVIIHDQDIKMFHTYPRFVASIWTARVQYRGHLVDFSGWYRDSMFAIYTSVGVGVEESLTEIPTRFHVALAFDRPDLCKEFLSTDPSSLKKLVITDADTDRFTALDRFCCIRSAIDTCKRILDDDNR